MRACLCGTGPMGLSQYFCLHTRCLWRHLASLCCDAPCVAEGMHVDICVCVRCLCAWTCVPVVPPLGLWPGLSRPVA